MEDGSYITLRGLLLDTHTCLSRHRLRRDRFVVQCGEDDCQLGVTLLMLITVSFHHPSLQGSQSSSASLSSTKVSSSVEDGDGAVNEGEKSRAHCSSVGRSSSFANITHLNHTYDL